MNGASSRFPKELQQTLRGTSMSMIMEVIDYRNSSTMVLRHVFEDVRQVKVRSTVLQEVSVDTSGNIYVVDSGNSRIEVFVRAALGSTFS